MIDNVDWHTIFSICGKNLDTALIDSKLTIQYSSFSKAGEIEIPTIECGAAREFDPRWALDRCSYTLTAKQLQKNLSDQLLFWCEKFQNSQSGLNYLTKNMNYWAVIDCQGFKMKDSHIPCLQYRIPVKAITCLSKLNVDIDFSID